MENYEELLDKVTKRVQEKMEAMGSDKCKVKGTEFERMVYEALVSEGIDDSQISHSVRKFPDFVITDVDSNKKLGLEVKKTDTEGWEILGGSIYESLRNQIEETFVLMGKFGGKPEIRLRKYKECIDDLIVTHSPRFHLNLALSAGDDYLTRNGAMDILDLKEKKELNRRIRELLRTDKSTWYTEDTVESFSNLSAEEKDKFFIDGVVLFPEVMKGDYSEFAPWMIYKCLVWCSNVRDVFSSGGIVEIGGVYVSAVMNRIINNIERILVRINAMTPKEIENHWGMDGEEKSLDERIKKWLSLVDSHIRISKDLIGKNRNAYFNDKSDEEIKKTIISTFIERLEKNLMTAKNVMDMI